MGWGLCSVWMWIRWMQACNSVVHFLHRISRGAVEVVLRKGEQTVGVRHGRCKEVVGYSSVFSRTVGGVAFDSGSGFYVVMVVAVGCCIAGLG